MTMHSGHHNRRLVGAAETSLRHDIAAELRRVRERTLALVGPLSPAQLERQVIRLMSPLIWDIGHIAHFERLWLVDAVEGRDIRPLAATFDALHTPREQRGALELKHKDAALEELSAVRAATDALLPEARLASGDPLLRDGYVYRMVIQHEAQHQETMLQTLNLPADEWCFDSGDAGEAVVADGAMAAAGIGDEWQGRKPARGDDRTGVTAALDIDDEARVTIPAGEFIMGTDDRSCAYDNERGAHAVDVPAFAIERYPVTNRRWREFVADGGYRRADLWSPSGWDWRRSNDIEHPQGWESTARDGRVWRFGVPRPLVAAAPVQHICYWEAEAFARWAGGRLPSEAQWEKAAAWDPTASRRRRLPWGDSIATAADTCVDLRTAPDTSRWTPSPVGQRPDLASPYGVEDLVGAVYQWTRSPFQPYPGFTAFPYDEYSAVFFGDTYRVLRGASWATDHTLWRTSYRNWDLPSRRQIFAGVRLVYDV